MVAWLLTAFWLPASSHVPLQHFGLIHQVHHDHHHDHEDNDAEPGHHEHGTDNHAAADGECLRSSGTAGWELPWGGFRGPPFHFVAALSVIVLPVVPETFGRAPPGADPLGLSSSWQFLLRAALPIRAPSLVS